MYVCHSITIIKNEAYLTLGSSADFFFVTYSMTSLHLLCKVAAGNAYPPGLKVCAVCPIMYVSSGLFINAL